MWMLVAEEHFWDSVDGEMRHATASAAFVTSPSAGSEPGRGPDRDEGHSRGAKPWPITEGPSVYSGSFHDLDGHV